MTLLDIRPSTSFVHAPQRPTAQRPTAQQSTAPSAAQQSATQRIAVEHPAQQAAIEPAHALPGSHLHAVPAGSGTEARGFVLYVGIDETKATANGTDLGHIVQALKQFTASLAPGAETYAAVALAPRGSGGRDVDIVRLALQDPAAVAAHREAAASAGGGSTSGGSHGHGSHGGRSARDGSTTSERVVIDFSRKRVTLDGQNAPLTYTEFELLQYLVLHEGRTVARAELLAGLWGNAAEGREHTPGDAAAAAHADIPNERTVDVHVRRLRAKLGQYDAIVRTVRGVGYRFDQHPDVAVLDPQTPASRLA